MSGKTTKNERGMKGDMQNNGQHSEIVWSKIKCDYTMIIHCLPKKGI